MSDNKTNNEERTVPTWEDDPGGYEFTATIVGGVVLNDGVQMGSDYDIFAAFDDSTNVRGIGFMLVPPFGPYEGTSVWEMAVRSNEAGDTISFKYYDASEDAELEISEKYTFGINDIMGDVQDPMIFNVGVPDLSCPETVDIGLYGGFMTCDLAMSQGAECGTGYLHNGTENMDALCQLTCDTGPKEDECGVCETDDDYQASAATDDCGVCDNDSSNDNTTCEQDCDGTYGGDAVEDDCGVCDSDASNDNSTCVQDCALEWGGDAVVDDCGVCDSDASNDNSTCVQDCALEWGGDAVVDDCGVCEGDGPAEGEDCDGNPIVVDIPGCTEVDACNYNVDATEDDSSCTYAATGYDCDGNLVDGWFEDCDYVAWDNNNPVGPVGEEADCYINDDSCTHDPGWWGSTSEWLGDTWCDTGLSEADGGWGGPNLDCDTFGYDNGDCLTCEEQGKWDCGDGQCIDTSYVCDGDSALCSSIYGPDCSNGADEGLDNCADVDGYEDECAACPEGQWDCGDGQCIYTNWVCDGVDDLCSASWGPDCNNGADEGLDNCAGVDGYEDECAACPEGQWDCGDGQCIDTSYVCDGDSALCSAIYGPDCSNGCR